MTNTKPLEGFKPISFSLFLKIKSNTKEIRYNCHLEARHMIVFAEPQIAKKHVPPSYRK